jgi:hypothetical protein
MNRRLDPPTGSAPRRRTGLPLDERQLDRLVQVVADELDRRTGPGASRSGSSGASGGTALVDNWRIRASDRDAFLAFYREHVAEVIRAIPGFVEGRILTSAPDGPYSWHVQATYVFGSADVVANFRTEFERVLRRTRSGMSMDKVLDAMDQWVLAHEDGVLEQVWS